MRWEKFAHTEEPPLDEIRLLAEAGFWADALEGVEALRRSRGDDPAVLGLEGHLAHKRGAISEAIQRWTLLHETSPQTHLVVRRLAALKEEEKRAPLLGGADLPWVRRALRAVTGGQLPRALAICREGRRSVGPADREEEKLLALLESLILELSGRYAQAAEVLEHLGRDPAYAHDIDRLAILARVRENLHEADAPEAAARVLEFLAESGKLSAYSRLIQRRRSLGDEPGARAAEEEYEEAFRRRMHRLSPEERLVALAGRPLPLSKLQGMRLPPLDEVSEPLPRGIVLLSRGRAKAALRALGARGGGWKAVALLAAGRGEEAAREAALAITAAGRLDAPLACVLAEALQAAPHADVPGAAVGTALAALQRAAAKGRPEADLLLHLARLEEHQGNLAAAAAHRERSHALLASPWPPPGVVRAAAIYALPGKPKGLVHDVIARRRQAGPTEGGRLLPDEIHGEFAPGSRDQVQRIFAAVREWILAKRPEAMEEVDAHAYGIHFTKEDEPSGGPSLGLPVAVAFASSMLQIPIPSHLVFTGALSYDGLGQIAVLPVGDVGIKLKGALHAGAETLVLPASQLADAAAGAYVPTRIAETSLEPVSSLDDAIRIVESGAG